MLGRCERWKRTRVREARRIRFILTQLLTESRHEAQGASSLPPDVPNPLIDHRSVDNRVRNRAMAHKGLKRPCVDSARRQGVSGSVPQHVGVDLEWQLSGFAKPFNQLLGTVDGKRRLPLR